VTSASSPGFQRQHLILTGANGYIGRAVVDAALAEGRRVTVLGRRSVNGARFVAWRLGQGIPAEAIESGTAPADAALVHLAHDWGGKGEVEDPNVTAARILRDSARQLGLGHTVFISSLSARPDALNRYGRTKFSIEALFDAADEASLQVGLVYGGPRIAMYGLLCRIVGLAPALPMIQPRQPVQPIHRDEVARGILAAVDRKLSGPVGLAGADPIEFGRFLNTLARRTRGRGVLVLPLPLGPVLVACRMLNALPLGPKVDPERVLGLAGVRFVETRADLERLGLTVRPFADGMAGEPAARRQLLAEGRCLLGFVLRADPGGALVRRYARAMGSAGALALPPLVRRWPALLRWVEPLGGEGDLRRRLTIALALAEASPEGERALSCGDRTGRLVRLAADLLIDVLAMPVRLVLGGLAR
jgi:nucleoside-diphosphate-sugar epimerase